MLFIEIFYLLRNSYQLIPECKPENLSLAQMTYPNYKSINTFVEGKHVNKKKVNCLPINTEQKKMPYIKNKQPPVKNFKTQTSTIYYYVQTPIVTKTKYLTIFTTPVKNQVSKVFTKNMPSINKTISNLTKDVQNKGKSYNFLEQRADKKDYVSMIKPQKPKTSTINVPITKTSTVYVKVPQKKITTQQLQFSPISTKSKVFVKKKTDRPQDYIKYTSLASYANLININTFKTTKLQAQTILPIAPRPQKIIPISVTSNVTQQPIILQSSIILKTSTVTNTPVILQTEFNKLTQIPTNINNTNQSTVYCTTSCANTNEIITNVTKIPEVQTKTKHHNIFNYNLTAQSNSDSINKKYDTNKSIQPVKSVIENANIKELKKVNKNIRNVYDLLKNQISLYNEIKSLNPKKCEIFRQKLNKKKTVPNYLDFDEYVDDTLESDTNECQEDISIEHNQGIDDVKKLIKHSKNKKKIQYKNPEKSYLEFSNEIEPTFKEFFDKLHHKIYYKDRRDNQFYEITSSEYENNEPIQYSSIVKELEKQMSDYDRNKSNYYTSDPNNNYESDKVLKMSDIIKGNSYDPCFSLFKNKIDQLASGNFAYCSLLDSNNYGGKGSLVYLSDII